MGNKNAFAERFRQAATTFMLAAEDLQVIYAVYFDRGYHGGGSDQITDPDVEDAEITAAQIAAGITATEHIDNYLNNAVVTPGDYEASFNALRRISQL